MTLSEKSENKIELYSAISSKIRMIRSELESHLKITPQFLFFKEKDEKHPRYEPSLFLSKCESTLYGFMNDLYFFLLLFIF